MSSIRLKISLDLNSERSQYPDMGIHGLVTHGSGILFAKTLGVQQPTSIVALMVYTVVDTTG